MKKIAELIIKGKYLVLAATLLLTIFFGYQLKNIRVNADLLSYLPDDDSVAVLFNKIGEKYGGTDILIVGIKTDNVFKFENLQLIKEITDSIKYTDGISFITSLTNIIDIKGTEEGIEISKLIDEYNIPQDPKILDSIKNYALSKDRYKNVIISSDLTTTIAIARISDTKNKIKIVNKIKNKLKPYEQHFKIFYGGLPVSMSEVSNIILHDVIYLSPIALLIIITIFYLGFRSFSDIIFPVITVIISIIWTFGLMSLLKYDITIISDVIPIILIAVGSAYSIHVINRIQEEIENKNANALINALAYIIIPVFLAAITTIFGFVSFIAGAYLTMIRDFGIFTAIGIFFSLILSITFIPALMSIFSNKKYEEKPRLNENKFLTFLTNNLSKWVFNHQKQVIVIWTLLIIVSIIGAFRVERKVNMLDYFKKNSEVRKTEELLQEKFTGSTPLYIKVNGNIQSPEVLNKMDKVQQYIETLPYIKQSQSVVDFIKEMNNVMGEGMKIPESEEKIQQLWFLLEGQDIMEQLVSNDLYEGLIQAYVATSEESVMRAINDSINNYINKNINNENCKMSLTGFPSIYKKLGDSIIESQIKSLLICILLVFLIISTIFKSIPKGFFAIIPIFCTLFILFGSMGWFNIPLDIATVLTGSITVGIGIDYAIHIITHFGIDYNKYKDINTAIKETLRISGRAVIINVLSVALGFLVMIFANLVPLQRVAILVAITMLTSGLAALTLLPVSLIIYRKKLTAIFNTVKNNKKNINNKN